MSDWKEQFDWLENNEERKKKKCSAQATGWITLQRAENYIPNKKMREGQQKALIANSNNGQPVS